MDYLILDIETASIPNAADFLPLEDIAPDGRLTDPKKIADDVAKKQKALLDAAALDLDLARIVCVGVSGPNVAKVVTCVDEEQEKNCLRVFAQLFAPKGYMDVNLVTFNGHKYDLPLLMRRARYLGVKFPALNLDRYKSPHIDLYEVLTLKGAIKAHGLRWYFKRLGYTDLLDCDPLVKGGGDVAQAVAEGRWDAIAEHCHCDVEGTRRLAQWLGVLPEGAAF